MADTIKENFTPSQVLVHIEPCYRMCYTFRKIDCQDK